MSKRLYNIFFNTHTVSGIVISVGLYVIFFAGAFALFRNEIKIWEEGDQIHNVEPHEIDFDNLLSGLHEEYDLTGRDLNINYHEAGNEIAVFISASKDTLQASTDTESHYFMLNRETKKTRTYQEHYHLGEFLYRLHFFQQLPVIGVYLAGFVSFFFLFAIITGVIVHWKKIISNFYQFDPKKSLKRVWTDAHTALGIIGLPFQFVFALSGTFFCLSLLVLLPANIMYNGNQDQLLADMRPSRENIPWKQTSDEDILSLNDLVIQAGSKWDGFHVDRTIIKNYRGTNMQYVMMGIMDHSQRFNGIGAIIYDAHDGTVDYVKDPTKLSFVEDAQAIYGRLHFGDFGGVMTKILYFILAIITCFVIITGVLIWIEARNKKSMTLAQRKYTAKVGHIYLAICLSMLPVTALSFIFSKITDGYFTDKLSVIYLFYFLSWIAFTIYYILKRDNYYTNKSSLLLGTILGFCIPIINGLVSHNWIWKMIQMGQYEIVLVDILWISISIVSFLGYMKITPELKERSTFTKFPL